MIFVTEDTLDYRAFHSRLTSLKLLISSPTHLHPNGRLTLIDLAFVSNKHQLTECRVISPLANSDHCGLRVSLKWRTYDRPEPLPPRRVWKYKDADFQKAEEMIGAVDWSAMLSADDPDSAAIIWQNKFVEIMSECVPPQYLPRRRKVPWLTSTVVCHIRRCNAAFITARKRNFQDLMKYKKLRKKVIGMPRKATMSYFKHLKPSNSKHFWKAIKTFNRKESSIPHFATEELLLPSTWRKQTC